MPVAGSIIAEIQAKVDLLAYVSQYVTLKRRGREYVGLCPFHAEKTPSFSLNAEKQVWHCYGCDAGGDIITFVRRYENIEFVEALRMLAARAGIELRESGEAKRHRSEREAIYEANAVAKSYFAAALAKSAKALAYAERRGIEDATLRAFAVGYAPDDWEGLTSALLRAGVDADVALRAGLISRRQQGQGHCDFFRDRLMLPVFNLTGEVIAFGGRALGDEQPKYLNTKNTAAYTKGQHVYGLQIARKAAAVEEAIIVVEGYLDCLALHQAGFGNAVASLGTAFTVEQARELRRVASNLYLCFDGDAAGQSATARSIDMLVDEGLRVRVARLPEGEDPDDVLRRDGAQAFKNIISGSQPWVDFKIEKACSRIASAFSSKTEVAREAMRVISHVRDPIERDQYVKMMARKLDIAETALRQIDTRQIDTRQPVNAARVSPQGEHRPRRAAVPAEPLSPERELLQLVLVRPQLFRAAADAVPPDEFMDEHLASAYAALSRRRDDIAAGVNPMTVLADVSNVAELTRLALSSPPLNLEEDERRLDRIVERFRRRRMERRLSNVDAEMNTLLTAGKSVPDPLRDEYNVLAATLHGSSQIRKEQT